MKSLMDSRRARDGGQSELEAFDVEARAVATRLTILEETQADELIVVSTLRFRMLVL